MTITEGLHEFDIPDMYGINQSKPRGRPKRSTWQWCKKCFVIEPLCPECWCKPSEQDECQCWNNI